MILKIEYIFILLFILKMSQTEMLQTEMSQTENLPKAESSKTIPLMTSYFPEILDKGTESHITWLLITCLIRNLIKRFDAIVFGGAVRDSILHSHASREFYKLSTRDKYDDPTIHPELSDRFLLPTDIDIFITYHDHYNFKLYLYRFYGITIM